jgi:hypothetical protein
MMLIANQTLFTHAPQDSAVTSIKIKLKSWTGENVISSKQ